jgi:hypothetical protein
LPSTCSWLDHSVSGLKQRTERPVQTRFRCAYAYRLKLARYFKSLTHYTKGTLSPRTNLGLQLFVGVRFQELFHSPFPHGTCSLSVAEEYLGLESGLPMFRQDYTCPALLVSSSLRNPYGAITHYGPIFQSVPVKRLEALAWSAFARHY